MATKSFNQVGKLLVASAANATARASVDLLGVGEVQAFSVDGGAAVAGEPFIVYQKTATGFEKSGVIDPKKIVSARSVDTVAKVQKSVVLTVPTVVAGETYGIAVRIFNHGSLSPENSYVLSAYDVADSTTASDLADKLFDLLGARLDREQIQYLGLSHTPGTADISIEAVAEASDSARKPASDVQFEVSFIGATASQAITPYVKGVGAGVDMADVEYNLRFNNGDQYGLTAFPNDFDTPTYIDKTKNYDLVHITYNGGREDHVVENQRIELILAVDSSLTLIDVNAQVIAPLDTVIGTVADLT